MNWINRQIIGKQTFKSGEEKKRVLVAGYFILIYLSTGVVWMLLGVIDNSSDTTMVMMGFFINILCFALVRSGWFYAGVFLLMARINGVTAYYVIHEPSNNNHLFFLTCGLGALAIFGHEKKKFGIAFALLSISLYLFLSIRPNDFIIGHDHFTDLMGYVMTYLSLAFLIYFFNYITYQYDQTIRHQNTELIKTNQELDRFVYTASHDIKAPLNSLTGLLNIARVTDDPKELKSMLQMMEGSIGTLKKFIGEVIDYTRNARTQVISEEVNLFQLIEDIYDGLQFDENAGHVEWKNQIPKDFKFQTDGYRVRMALNNLLSNAVQYADLSKENPFVEIKMTQADGKLVIAITDNGIGIAQENMPKLFQMFYRATTQ